ncbi:MAG: S-adenosylmethionine:tRNA ribosyltransferase-isomerase [Bacteroidia bacterium]
MIPEKFLNIKLSDFDYLLPEERIAQNPLDKRDESKLLVYEDGEISNFNFKKLPELLPPNSQLIFNNAKVIPARLNFYRATGAKIEVFLLEPESPFTQMELALRVSDKCVWQCMIGNLKRWKDHETLTLKLENTLLNAKLISRERQLVEMSWDNDFSFSTILELAGKMPLPPYIKRDAEVSDSQSYQTIFAKQEGAVAAPTAGLHFSNQVLKNLEKKGINTSEVTLYVGAGTFAPVNVETMVEHNMHAELISVTQETIDQLLEEKTRIAVGTTSLRTLESLYWIGVKLDLNEIEPFEIEKLFPYTFLKLPLTWNESLQKLKNYMTEMNLEILTAKTAIMIMPGYKFTSVKGLITNFHYPNTTLIMLVAAFIGDDWQKVYRAALDNDYRFLSYGDSSLLFPMPSV